VKYFLNLVLVDEEDRRYFKQQEVVFWRKHPDAVDNTSNRRFQRDNGNSDNDLHNV